MVFNCTVYQPLLGLTSDTTAGLRISARSGAFIDDVIRAPESVNLRSGQRAADNITVISDEGCPGHGCALVAYFK